MYLNVSYKFGMLFAWILFTIVLLLSPAPLSDTSESVTFIDKIVHAFLFGILTFLTFYLLTDNKTNVVINPERIIKQKNKRRTTKKAYIAINDLLRIFLTTFFIATSLSIVLEYLQVYIPGRSPNDYDLLASSIGIILVLIFIYGDNYSKKET